MDSVRPSTTASSARPGTPESEPTLTVPKPNPFSSPYGSAPPSRAASTTGFQHQPPNYFHSRRIKKGEIERPWLDKKDPREKWVTIIPVLGILLGIAVSAFLIYDGLQTVQTHSYCSIYEDDFSGGLNSKVWTKEVEVGGFGYIVSWYHACSEESLTTCVATVNSRRRQIRTKMSSSKTGCSPSSQLCRTRS